MAEQEKLPETAGDQMYNEIHKVITRYAAEGGVTYRECFGVLEHVKLDLSHELHVGHDRRREEGR